MFMKRMFIWFMIALSAVTVTAQGTFNYFCGFENPQDTDGWFFKTGRRIQTNFTVGRAARRLGSFAMYVSADNGATAGYVSTASGFITVAYRQFHFTAGSYDMNFDLRIVGQAPETDALRVAYFPTTRPDGTSQEPKGAALGTTFPQEALLYPFVDEYTNKQVFAGQGWHNHKGTLVIPSDGDYYVAFYFRESGGLNTDNNPGACIDNIQITNHRQSTDCAAMPKDLTVSKASKQFTLSWSGNATSYDVIYSSQISANDTTYKYVQNLTDTFFTTSLQKIPEGNYSFRVRAVCGEDTSIWVEKSNVLVYDPTAHCLDYLNFYAPGVTCTSGGFADPYQSVGVVDNGPEVKSSMHTVHYMQDEYDRLTGYELKTVPDGALASVRLSNWTEYDSPSGSIEYTYKVQEDAKVLLLRYAAVLQYASHHPAEEQTRIHVEIQDMNGRLLSHCTEADFNARDVAEGNTRGWRTYIPTPADEMQSPECPIKWLDWSVLGINMEAYIGQTVKIKLTLYACSADFHFGYAYFVLDCSKGDIEGMSCGKVPTQFTVSDGFNYKWYKMSNGEEVPESQLSEGGRVFTPLHGDTCSYFVDLMYPEDHNCKFTLRAYTLPRVPVSDISYLCRPRDCQNIVEFTNLSGVYSYLKDGTEILRPDTIDTYLWDFGPRYGTSQEKNPQLVIPLEGDTFTAILQTGYNNCYDTKEFEIQVPAIQGESFGKDTAYICEGESVVFNNKTYDLPGDYIDTLSSVYGCDSILSLHLKVLVPDSIVTDTTICSDEVMEFFGQKCDTTGTYIHRIPSSLGCDTLYYEMHLTVLDALEASIATAFPEICSTSEEEYFDVPYTVTRGMVSSFSIDYDADAERVGFTDVDSTAIGDGTITLTKPANIRPGHYSATVTLYNSDCGNLALPINFDILYPSSVITQRWNDVLAVLNRDYNGGYEFNGFQWYVNDTIIENANSSICYAPGGLRVGSQYRVELTRSDDGVRQFTCGFYPQTLTKPSEDAPTVVFAGSVVAMESSVQGKAYIYNMGGILVSVYDLVEGVNTMITPQQPGIYILQIVSADEIVSAMKIVVQ